MLAASLLAGGGAAQPAVHAQGARTVVNLWALASTPWDVMMDRYAKVRPDVEVRWTKYGTDAIKEALRVGASAGTMPDAWYNWGGSLASAYESGGQALDLTDRLARDGIDKTLIPASLRLAAFQGRLYGVPYRITPVSFVYRKSVFAKVGATPPKTFAELEDICTRLKAAGITPFGCGGKYSWLTMRFTDFLIEHFAGPELNDKLMSMQASWNCPEIVATFAKLQEWVKKGYFPDGFLAVDPMQDTTPMFDGTAAMVVEVPRSSRRASSRPSWTSPISARSSIRPTIRPPASAASSTRSRSPRGPSRRCRKRRSASPRPSSTRRTCRKRLTCSAARAACSA